MQQNQNYLLLLYTFFLDIQTNTKQPDKTQNGKRAFLHQMLVFYQKFPRFIHTSGINLNALLPYKSLISTFLCVLRYFNDVVKSFSYKRQMHKNKTNRHKYAPGNRNK